MSTALYFNNGTYCTGMSASYRSWAIDIMVIANTDYILHLLLARLPYQFTIDIANLKHLKVRKLITLFFSAY